MKKNSHIIPIRIILTDMILKWRVWKMRQIHAGDRCQNNAQTAGSVTMERIVVTKIIPAQ